MARRGHSAWLPLVAVLLFAAAAATTEGCCSGKLPPGRSFQRCTSLPVLGASLYWTYHPRNGTADVAFRAPQSSGGWVAWGINGNQSAGMVGAGVFIASQDGAGAGAVAVLTTVLESYRPSLTNGSLKFDVPVPPAAEYVDGAYTIYATVALPMNSTVQNTVWQAGPGSTGAIRKHATSGQNMQSVQKLDFLAGETIGASNSTTP
ncbi:cytochrome b561 and DOMON domain-containing protein At5g48750-like [Oryza brachyantha]|uniref:cytochrome b561 and DOMON domain-containing protein At5g48750-like n=1 Tax=Oryza brachyantha TaxID=4533 RepID=UPI001ADA2A17|nr:cytochrome b561 and DOMON domain-containing protein At5g48750-like [Oryza brachyantha]